MVPVLPVPQDELKKLAQANLTLSSAASDMLALIDRIKDPELQRSMLEAIRSIADVAETIDRTVRSAVYTATPPQYAA